MLAQCDHISVDLPLPLYNMQKMTTAMECGTSSTIHIALARKKVSSLI